MPDSQPNYLVTDQTGKVGAVFSGLVSASGIQLPYQPFEGPGVPGAGFSNEIQWLNEPGQYSITPVLGSITATRGGVSESSSWTYQPELIIGSKLFTQIRMRHFLLGAPANDRNVAQIEAFVQGYADGVGTPGPMQSVKLLDQYGVSSFVQKKNVLTKIMGSAGALGAYYSPWAGYPTPYPLQYDWWDDGLFVLRGMVYSSGAGAFASQYVCTVPTPAPRLGGSQRILYTSVGPGTPPGQATIYCNMRFDIVPLTSTACVMVFNGYMTGPPDGSACAWCPINLAYYTDLPWGQAFYS